MAGTAARLGSGLQPHDAVTAVHHQDLAGDAASSRSKEECRRIRDFAQIKGDGSVNQDIARYGLAALDVDEAGLDEMDIRILTTIIHKFKGGPVGLTTIATAVGEEAGTIEEVHEPFLIMEGYIQRTPRGRTATEKAYKHIGAVMPGREGRLF